MYTDRTLGYLLVILLQLIVMVVQLEGYEFGFSKRQQSDDPENSKGYRMGYIFGKRSYIKENSLLQAISRQNVNMAELLKLAQINPALATLIYKNTKDRKLVKVEDDFEY